MSPEDKGRFCLSCQKTVVDFTKMDKAEIQQYFQTAVNEKVCGRIKATDLAQDNILPEVHVYPNRFFVAPNHTPSRLFLLTVGLVFLYSCNTSPENLEQEPPSITQESDVRDIDSNAFIIGDTVVLPEKEPESYPFVLGEIIDEDEHAIDNRPTKREPDCPPPPPDFDTNPNPVLIKQEFVFGNVFEPELPEFPGGDVALTRFIQDNLVYDTNTMIAGRVYVRCFVETDGSVQNISIARGLSPANDAEAMRVVTLLPNFIPGHVRGKAQKTSMVIPIVFR